MDDEGGWPDTWQVAEGDESVEVSRTRDWTLYDSMILRGCSQYKMQEKPATRRLIGLEPMSLALGEEYFHLPPIAHERIPYHATECREQHNRQNHGGTC